MANAEWFKKILSFGRKNNRIYERLRGEIKCYMEAHGIANRTQAGETAWGAVVDWVLAHQSTRPARERYQSKGVEGRKELRQAAHFLCLSCAKSITASRAADQGVKEGGQPSTSPSPTTAQTPPAAVPTAVPMAAAAQTPYHSPVSVRQNDEIVHPATATATTTSLFVPPSVPTGEKGGRSIRVCLCDPEGNTGRSPWSGKGIVEVRSAMLTEQTYLELERVCKKYVPEGRFLQEILGATGNPAESSDIVALTDDEEVQAWLLDTEEVRPLRVLAILNRGSTPGPTSVSIQSACLIRRRPQ